MVRASFVVVTALALVAAWPASAVRAACVAAVVVDGQVLFGHQAGSETLPPAAGERAAVFPACNDAGQNDPDRTGTVIPFEGVPASVAVRSAAGDTVYVAEGSLTALAAHPLHQPGGRRSARRGCGDEQRIDATAKAGGFDSLTLLAGGRERIVRIDARSRLSNRPAYQPVSPGQRLRVTMTRCRNRLFADRIAFVGATVTPAPYVLQHGAPAAEPVPWGLVALGLVGLALAAMAVVHRVLR